jgi:replication-associated recombination protein RarA
MNNPKKIRNFKDFVKQYGDIDGNEDSEKVPCIILAGPPGCGKGTQARIIAKGMRWKHISTGDILRDSDDKEIKKLMKTGNLLPDDLVGKELLDYLKKLTKHSDPKVKSAMFWYSPRIVTATPVAPVGPVGPGTSDIPAAPVAPVGPAGPVTP